MGWWSEDKKII